MSLTMRSLFHNPFAWVVFIALIIRVTTLGQYPLADLTEARYSEMARIMVETGNWLTPQFDYNVPFWGKPPLSVWATAMSFKVFGVNEFAARFPSILIALGTLFFAFVLARQQLGARAAWLAAAFLATDMLFFLLSGAVLMDPMMTLGITLSMVAFWLAMKQRERYWGYLFFVGLSIGLMSKGPVAVVLTGVPIVFWLLLSGQWRFVWQRVPVISGTLLMLALSLPWYFMAENATPGFFEYFIIGEHWKRFTEPGWSGDLYGTAHTSQVGAIWLNWLAVAFPMSLILIATLVVTIWREKIAAISVLREDWTLYLILWAMTPMLFFTFSGNILATYVLPSMPAAALLVAVIWLKLTESALPSNKRSKKIISATAIGGLLLPLIYLYLVYVVVPQISDEHSEKLLVEKYHQVSVVSPGGARLVYLNKRPFSARFYSNGKAELVKSEKKMQEILNETSFVFFAIPVKQEGKLTETFKSCLGTVQRYKKFILFQADEKNCKR